MKEDLIKIFNDCPFLDKTQIARLIKMDDGNFRAYVGNNNTKVTEKTYNKIKGGLDLALELFTASLNKN